jgi:hypothetical protein
MRQNFSYTEDLKQHYWARSDVIACTCSTPICLKAKNLNSVAAIHVHEKYSVSKRIQRSGGKVGIFFVELIAFFRENVYENSLMVKIRFSIIVKASLLDGGFKCLPKKVFHLSHDQRIALLLIRNTKTFYEFREKILKTQL